MKGRNKRERSAEKESEKQREKEREHTNDGTSNLKRVGLRGRETTHGWAAPQPSVLSQATPTVL